MQYMFSNLLSIVIYFYFKEELYCNLDLLKLENYSQVLTSVLRQAEI